LEIRDSFSRVSTRPLVLIVALLCALAIGLVGYQALGPSAGPASTIGKPFVFNQDRPGPDAPSRNRPGPVLTTDPWANHGT